MQTLDLTRTYTYEEYLEISERPEFAGRKVELLDGELIIEGGLDDVAGSRQLSTILAALLITYLNNYVLPRRLGIVSSSDGEYKFSARTGLIPDTGFIRKGRAGKLTYTEPFKIAPDLAVEVISQSERPRDIEAKTKAYLSAGTLLVWRFYPLAQKVEVITASKRFTLERNDTLDGGDVLPGFSLSLGELWQTLEDLSLDE